MRTSSIRPFHSRPGRSAFSPIKTELTKLRSDALQIPNREHAVRASHGQKIIVRAPYLPGFSVGIRATSAPVSKLRRDTVPLAKPTATCLAWGCNAIEIMLAEKSFHVIGPVPTKSPIHRTASRVKMGVFWGCYVTVLLLPFSNLRPCSQCLWTLLRSSSSECSTLAQTSENSERIA